MKRIALIVGLIGTFGALAHYVLTHPVRERVERLRTEYQSLRQQNEELADDNDRLRREIEALRNDPRLAERRARSQAGLAHPNELIVQFEDDEEGNRLQIELRVASDEMSLAGEPVEFGNLSARLQQLHADLPESQLNVRVDDEVGPLRKERVATIVEESKFAPAQDRLAAE